MERRTSDAPGTAWFMAAVQVQDDDAEPDDRTPLDVMIAVSLDELDGMTGELLV